VVYKFTYCLALLLLVAALNGQNIRDLRFDRITTEKIIIEKGLSQNTGLCIMEDHYGFMWFGTWDGLNRYDGYDFSVFDNESGLSNNTVRDLFEDRKGMIWIATEGGLDRLDPVKKEIQVFRYDAASQNNLSNDFVTDIHPDGHMLWVATADGLNKMDMTDYTFTHINFFSLDAPRQQSNYINKVYLDSGGNLWVCTRYGLHYRDAAEEQFIPYYHSSSDVNSIPGNVVTTILQESENIFWIGTTSGLCRINKKTNDIDRYYLNPLDDNSLSNNTITALLKDSNGDIWIGTPNMLNIYLPDGDNFLRYKNTNSSVSLSNNDIRSLFQDVKGDIWVGTYKGINKLDRSHSRFPLYHHIPADQQSLSNNIVYSIFEDRNGNPLIGTYGGVNIMDREKETFTVLKYIPGNPNSLTSDKIRTVLEDSERRIWIGTESSGISIYNPTDGSFEHIRHHPGDTTTLIDNRIMSMKEGYDGKIWIGTRGGMDLYDPLKKKLKHFYYDPLDNSGITSPIIWCFYLDEENKMWVGTDNGLLVFNEEGNRVAAYFNNPADEFSISGNRILFIGQDEEGLFWIGTIGMGLNKFDTIQRKFHSYKEKDGLPNNVIYAALSDGRDNLWISTNMGLVKFDKGNETFVVYDAKDGIQGNEFNGGAYFKNSKGELFFGGMSGFNLFDPEEITINEAKPTVVITDVKVFGESLDRNFYNGDTIALNFNDNFFSIEFTALAFTNPSKNLFRYKLDNYDDEWNSVGANQRSAVYKKVVPGEYTFHILAANNDGIWNEEGVRLTILISPPWWETWAFRLPFALFIIASFWVVIYYRFKNLKKKHEVEKKMLDIEKQVFSMEQKALRLQMNPHFIFNTLNAIQSFIVANETEKAIPYLAKFSHLMRMILANSSEEYIPLNDELKSIRYYMDLEKLRFDNKFEYHIRIANDMDTEFIEIPPMIIQPYIENAIIHGLIHKEDKGRLDLTMEIRNKSILCTIIDDGIGRDKSNELREKSGIKRQPRGMIITEQRLDILKKQKNEDFDVQIKDLYDNNEEPNGTRIDITFHYRNI